MSRLMNDENFNSVPLMVESAPQNAITVNGSAGAAVLTGAISKSVVRIHCTVDMYVMFTVAGAVTPSIGHFRAASPASYDMPVPAGMTKLSALAVGTTAGLLYLSELG